MEFLHFNYKSLVFFTTCSPSDEEQLVLPWGREVLRSPVRNVPCLNVSSFVCLCAIAWLTLAKWNLTKEKEDSHHHPLFVFLAHWVHFPKFLAFHVKIYLEQFFCFMFKNKCIISSFVFCRQSFTKWLTLWCKNKSFVFLNYFPFAAVEVMVF